MDATNAGQDIDSAFENAKKEYLDFLDDAVDLGINSTRIKDMVDAKTNRVELDVNYLRTKNLERCRQLLDNANMEMAAFQDALRDLMANKYPEYSQKFEEFYIGLVGAFGFRHCSPRTINAKFLGGIVCVEGIVTKASLIHPKILRSVHFCPKTGKTLERRYADLTTYNAVPSSTAYPTKDDEGNLLETEYGMCVYKDHQTVYLQELPEKSPAGQLPRSVEVIMDGDLVDAVKPGDRILCVGVFKPMPSKKQGYTSGNFKTIIIANNIIHVDIKDDTVQYSAEDIEIMRKICKKYTSDKNDDIVRILTKSVAPSIYGLEHEKEALLCMLVGGNETVLPNGTRLRGDINIMLVGDPSVAKSQLLRYVVQVAPRAVTTTGRGSSGVGLTAAVTNDSETGDRRLEAGAMVLADRGVVCIDEFDKMTELDRTAIHEVMEQGRVTIAKAGIHAQLNARCSVLAAANPIYGKYNPYKSPMDNIAMPDSLLSRFDLIFIMTDNIDAEQDGIVAGHVLNMHRYRDPKEREGQASNFDQLADWLSTRQLQDKEAEANNNNFGGGAAAGGRNNARDNVYEKENVLLQPPTKSGATTRSKLDKLFSKRFMKMFIGSARATRPELTVEACDYIAEAYAHLRSEESAGDEARTQVVTVRALETMIRLTIAYAKLHLSKRAKIEHAQRADEMVQYAYFRKVEKKPRKPKADTNGTTNGVDADADETDEEEQTAADADAAIPAAKTTTNGRHDAADMDDGEEDEEEDDDIVRISKKRRNNLNGTVEGQNNIRPTRSGIAAAKAVASAAAGTPSTASVSRDRLRQVQAAVVDAFASRGSGSIQQSTLTEHVKESVPFATDDEISQAFEIMHQQNKIMIADNFVFKV